MREQKQKLTLGINKTIIERAKDAGINISAITEELLTAITYQPNVGNTDQDVLRAYQALFDAISNITANYGGAWLEVGVFHNKKAGQKAYPIIYTDQGFMSGDFNTGPDQYRLEDVINHLYNPSKILSNLISALIKEAERNKERVKELEMALQFVKVLTHNGDENNEPRKQ